MKVKGWRVKVMGQCFKVIGWCVKIMGLFEKGMGWCVKVTGWCVVKLRGGCVKVKRV